MEQRLTVVTLGVANVQRSRQFYEALGWQPHEASTGDIVFISLLNGVVLSLYPRHALAEDVTVADTPTGFSGITLAHSVRSKEDGDRAMALAEAAGAKVIKPMQDVFWGGYSGYFADLDGHLWEVAWNPHFPLDQNGCVQLRKL